MNQSQLEYALRRDAQRVSRRLAPAEEHLLQRVRRELAAAERPGRGRTWRLALASAAAMAAVAAVVFLMPLDRPVDPVLVQTPTAETAIAVPTLGPQQLDALLAQEESGMREEMERIERDLRRIEDLIGLQRRKG